MIKENIGEKLGNFSVSGRNTYFGTAFSRSLGVVNANDFEKLKNSRVAIPGMGGVGGSHLITLVRAGIGRFRLADYDTFDPVNINRQYGANVNNFGRAKIDVMSQTAYEINPYLEIDKFSSGLSLDNIDKFLEEVDVVIDGLDFFVFDIRRELFMAAHRKGIPVITAGPLGFSSALLVFTSDSMNFDQYFDIQDNDSYLDCILKFAIGLSPRGKHFKYMDDKFVDLAGKRGPSFGSACQLCAGLATTEAVRILLGRGKVKAAPYFHQFDPYTRKYIQGKLSKGNRAYTQRAKLWLVKNLMIERKKTIGPVVPDFPDLRSEGFGAVWDYIIRAGIQAPSGDNCQPWIYIKDDNGITLRLDSKADDSFFNLNQSASIISCGAAVENMVLASKACGFDPMVSVREQSESGLSVKIDLEKDDNIHEPQLFDSIWKRTTNRKPFDKKMVVPGIWETAAESLSDLDGISLHWISDRERLSTFAKAVFIADQVRAERRDLHEFLFEKIRFTREEAALTRDGLPLDNLEAGFVGNYFLKALRKWSVAKVLNTMGASKGIAKIAEQGVLRSGGIGLVCADSYDPDSIFRAGRAFQRSWLTFTHYGIEFQPIAAPALFRMRVLERGDDCFSPEHRQKLKNTWPIIEQCFPGFSNKKPILFFRIGFGKSIKYGTYRRPLESFIS